MKPYVRNLLIAGGIAAGLAGAGALAQDRGAAGEPGMRAAHGMHQHDMRGGGERWLRGLNLTEAQRDQVFKIFHEQAPVLREHAKAARARALADAQAKAMAEASFLRADAMSRVVQILTPEQREKLQQRRK